MKVHIFILGHHLGFVDSGGLGQRNICQGSRHEVKKGGSGHHPPPHPHLCSKPLLIKHQIIIQDGGIEDLVYLVLCSKITSALQTIFNDVMVQFDCGICNLEHLP